ncbi:MAG: hypothetical protein GX221_08670 [Candidatus Riflebacteria bacterium]|nr:hypothetical protein [Candidatus Riflebacteria bacterium]
MEKKIALILAILGSIIFFGCLGMSSSDDSLYPSGSSIVGELEKNPLFGRIYFKNRQIYGYLPVFAKRPEGTIAMSTMTNEAGIFSFENLPHGVYNFSANAFNSEITFKKNLQYIGQEEKLFDGPLLEIKSLLIHNVKTNSFSITFKTFANCDSEVSIARPGEQEQVKIIGQGAQNHTTQFTDLSPGGSYNISIKLKTPSQELIKSGLSVTLATEPGPTNYSFNPSDGKEITSDKTLDLNILAANASEMRVSWRSDFDDSPWETFKPSKTMTFPGESSGQKIVYLQLKSEDGNLSPVISTSITRVTAGFLGIWLNEGKTLTSSNKATLDIVFPTAEMMMISLQPDFSGSFFEPMKPRKEITFSSEEGEKTVYAKFKGGLANEYDVYTASIILKTQPPVVTMNIDSPEQEDNLQISHRDVTLFFSSDSPPYEMQIKNDVQPSSNDKWIKYANPCQWTLNNQEGERRIYARFRDEAGNLSDLISATVTLDYTPPLGNLIAVKPNDTPTSTAITEATLGELPVFLHFELKDESTEQVFYKVFKENITQEPEYQEVPYPFAPIRLTSERLQAAKYILKAYFKDKAGNSSQEIITKLLIKGPKIAITADNLPLTSGKTKQLEYQILNADPTEVEPVTWSIANGGEGTNRGTITQSGLYTAPNPITDTTKPIIKVSSTQMQEMTDSFEIILKPTTAILFKQPNGSYSFTNQKIYMAPQEISRTEVYVLHSTRGVDLLEVSHGQVSFENQRQAEYGTLVDLVYTAPSTVADDVIVKIASKNYPEITASLSYGISTGPSISLEVANSVGRRGNPITLSAVLKNSLENKVTWKIPSALHASFSPDNDLTTFVTEGAPHQVLLYPKEVASEVQLTVTATAGEVSNNTAVKIIPPLKIEIHPNNIKAMPLVEPLRITTLLSNTHPAFQDKLVWELKNAAHTGDFSPGSEETNYDRGTLSIDPNTFGATYKRPIDAPHDFNQDWSNSVILRVSSEKDPNSFALANITILEKLKIEIHDKVELNHQINSASTVIEVGKLRFFHKLIPADVPNTAVTWSIDPIQGADLGTVANDGTYTAPLTSELQYGQVTVRATSVYDPSATTTVKVTLTDFWMPKREGMTDTLIDAPMPIKCLQIAPVINANDNKNVRIFAGAGDLNKNYGIFYRRFNKEEGDDPYWQPVTKAGGGLITSSVDDIQNNSANKMYAATKEGIYYIDIQNRKAIKVKGSPHYDPYEDRAYHSITFDTENPRIMYAAGTDGIYKITLNEDYKTYSNFLYLIDTMNPYFEQETRQTQTQDDPPITYAKTAYSNKGKTNPINSPVSKIKFADHSLYALCQNSTSYTFKDKQLLIPMYSNAQREQFYGDPPSVDLVDPNPYIDILITSPPAPSTIGGLPMDITVDVINSNKVWAATSKGVFMSIDSGATWQARSFGAGGVDTNTRCILLDPTNVINVMAGSEDGVYRSTNSGGTWMRIRSGLGSHKTITSMVQSEGEAGTNRHVWVGTSGGVFQGKASLGLE